MLTVERLRSLLDYYPEAGVFIWRVSTKGHKAGRLAGSKNSTTGYLSIAVDGRSYSYARLVWFYVYGRWPVRFIDHINLDVFDNRISNLRECSRSQNNANRRARNDSKSGIKGVRFWKQRNCWVARIKINKKGIHLGCFKTMEEAKLSYNSAAKLYFGEFARAS